MKKGTAITRMNFAGWSINGTEGYPGNVELWLWIAED
jgi:hypothetical protein